MEFGFLDFCDSYYIHIFSILRLSYPKFDYIAVFDSLFLTFDSFLFHYYCDLLPFCPISISKIFEKNIIHTENENYTVIHYISLKLPNSQLYI